MGVLIPGEHEERGPEPFNVLRCIVAVVTGGVGMGLGVWLALYGGSALDEALGYPMGRSSGFLSMGHMTTMCIVLGPPLGTVLGALGGHALLGGRGSFWVALGAMFLGLVPVILASLAVRGLVVPPLLLVPLAVAVGLELSNRSRG
jgi:hypothetical protein